LPWQENSLSGSVIAARTVPAKPLSSAKLDVTPAGLFSECTKEDLHAADKAEGSAYRRLTGSDDPIPATTYLAKESEVGLKPYDWYLALVVAGARQHNINSGYSTGLSHLRYEIDTKLDRRSRKEAIEVLKTAGHVDYGVLLPVRPDGAPP
jgi:gamma-glutamylcyclotransferase